jgi:hypothetical protein
MAPSGIEPAAFRFVAQYLNHCATSLRELDNKIPLVVNERERRAGGLFDIIKDNWFILPLQKEAPCSDHDLLPHDAPNNMQVTKPATDHRTRCENHGCITRDERMLIPPRLPELGV